MGVALTQILPEDRASGAQGIDGSLRFDGSQRLERTFANNSGTTWTWSAWIKITDFGLAKICAGADEVMMTSCGTPSTPTHARRTPDHSLLEKAPDNSYLKERHPEPPRWHPEHDHPHPTTTHTRLPPPHTWRRDLNLSCPLTCVFLCSVRCSGSVNGHGLRL